jgi:hypothetical protein
MTEDALLRLVRADPDAWPGLAPRVAEAVGAQRLREIAESTRQLTGGAARIEPGAGGGYVASGPGGSVLLWGTVDADGLVTSLWITPQVNDSRPGRGLAAVYLVLLVFSALAALNLWIAHSRADWVFGACGVLFFALIVEGLGRPAQMPWWIRRTIEAMWLSGLLSAVRLPGLGRPAVNVTMVVGIAVVVLVAVAIWRIRTRKWDAAVSAPLTFPLRGRWYVVQGGASRAINHHVTVPRQRAALDLVRTGRHGTKGGAGNGNEAYLAYRQSVFAPCDGTVIAVRDGLPDQVPGTVVPQPAEGNEVVIDTGREQVRLCHLRRGTVRVAKGQQVRTGELLGEVGNSGNTSEPHLHIEASRDGVGVDLRFVGNPGRYRSGRTLRG